MDSNLLHALEAIRSTIDHLTARIACQQTEVKALETMNTPSASSKGPVNHRSSKFNQNLNSQKFLSSLSPPLPNGDATDGGQTHRLDLTHKPKWRTTHRSTHKAYSHPAFTLPARQVSSSRNPRTRFAFQLPPRFSHKVTTTLSCTLPPRQVFSSRSFTFQLPPRLVFHTSKPGSGSQNTYIRQNFQPQVNHLKPLARYNTHTRNLPPKAPILPASSRNSPIQVDSPPLPQPVSHSLSLLPSEGSSLGPLSEYASSRTSSPPIEREKASLKTLKHISISPFSSLFLFSPGSPVTSSQSTNTSHDTHILPARISASVRFSASHSEISFFPSDPPLLLKSSLPSTLRPGFFKWGSSTRPPKVSSYLSFFDSRDYDPPFPYQDDAFLPQGPRKSRISPLFVPLKPIPKGALDLSYLSNSACKVSPEFGRGYQTLISYITELESFLSLFLSHPPKVRPGKRSKLSQRDLADLLDWQVLIPCPRSVQPPFFHFSFKVLKSDPSWSRYIIDCSVLNSYQKDPPSFSLPSPLRIIETILSCEYGFVTDFSAWFHQHWVSPEISPFFAVRVNSSPFLCSRLAQGWKFSPCTAQGSSLILAFDPDFPDSSSLSWIDDNFFGDSSESRLDIRRKNFLERCSKANAKVGSISDISDTMIYVGMEFHLKEKKWRIKPSWTEKLLSFFLSLSLSQQQFHAPAQVLWILLGSFLWFLRCSCLPLALLDPLISQTIDISPRLIDGSLLWTDVITFWPSVVSCSLSLISMIKKNAWRFIPHPLPFTPTNNFLFSDASLSGGAVVFEDKVIWSTTWNFDTAHTDILYLETLAWAAGIRLIPSLGIASAVTVVDNEALYFSLLKTRSKNPKVNTVITDLCLWAENKHLLLYTGWISTKLMPADGPSRGQTLPSGSPSQDKIRLSSHPFVFATDFMS